MSCRVYSVYAPNGQKSKLYEDLLDVVEDEETALYLWSLPRTQRFRQMIGNWQDPEYMLKDKFLDENGEVKVDVVLGKSKSEALVDQDMYTRAKKEAEKYVVSHKKMTAYKDKMTDALTRRISELENSKSAGSEQILADLTKLRDNLESLDWRETSQAFAAEAFKTIQYSLNQMDAETDLDVPDAKKMTRLFNYLVAFDVLDEMVNEIESIPQMSSTMKNELEILREIIVKKNAGKTKFMNYLVDHVAEVLSKMSYKHSKEDIRSLLAVARFDITKPEMLTRFLGDSKDPILALTAKLVNEAQQKTRTNVIDFNVELTELLERVEKENPAYKNSPEKLYAPILQTIGGKLSGNVISPNSREYTEFAIKYNGTALYDFYHFFISKYDEANSKLPQNYQMGYRLPGILKGDLETISTSENKIDNLTAHFDKMIKKSNLDQDRGELTDDAQRTVKKLPIFYTQTYHTADYNRHYKKFEAENTSATPESLQALTMAAAKQDFTKVVSFDLAKSLSMFNHMAENYGNMLEIVDTVEGIKYLVQERQVMETDFKGNPLLNKLTGLKDETRQRKGASSNAYAMLSDFIDMQLYGNTSEDLGAIAGTDIAKLIKLLMKGNSILQLGLNVFGATTNKIMGEFANLSEAVGGELYNVEQYRRAIIEYNKKAPDLLADAGRRLPENIINLINEKYNVLGDYRPKGATSESNAWYRRLASSSSLFFLMSAGEHSIQSKVAIAAMIGMETFDKNGNSTGNLFEAHEAKGRKLSIKPGTYIIDRNTGELVLFDKEQANKLSRNIQATLRTVHGNYNSETAAAWQKNGYLELFGQFRKWIPEGVARRFGDEYTNEFADRDRKGTYKSFGLAMKNIYLDLKQQQVLMGANWETMTPLDKANAGRAAVEAGVFVAMGVAYAALKALADSMDDDEDEFKRKRAALQLSILLSNRVMSEISFYVYLPNTWQILKTPIPSMNIMGATGELIQQALPWNIDERYVSGARKGDLKVVNKLKKVIPIWRQLERLTPAGLHDQYQYLNMK